MKCRLHPQAEWVYLPRRGIAICQECVGAGFYNEEISEEAKDALAEQQQRVEIDKPQES